MIEPEISETYRFRMADFDSRGRRKTDGETFRNVIKTYEHDFHARHSNEFALNLYANARTMHLLECSCDADSHLMYGMDLTQGKSFDPESDPRINHAMNDTGRYILVYGIDSAFMTEESESGCPAINEDLGIYPLTLLIDSTMSDETLRLSVPTGNDDEETAAPVDIPEYVYI